MEKSPPRTSIDGAVSGTSYEERCRLALEIALERTPLYASWRGRDLGPGHDIDARYRSLPLLTKDDIRKQFPYGLVPRGQDLDAALERGEVSFVRTSGTADEALLNIWNQEWWNASERASWRLNAFAARVATGAHAECILASALSVGKLSEGAPIERAQRMLGRFLFLNEYGRTEQWPSGHEGRILAELADYQPAVLEANPSLLARVARWAFRTGVDAWQPPLITLTYEFPSALHLRAIRQVFSCPIASSYGSTEAGYVLMECEQGMLHQNGETCRVDIVPLREDHGGDAVLPGALGKIVATTFGNAWFPLLRFEVGDVGRLATKPCPCGRRAGVTLDAVEGRLKSLCVRADGTPITHGRIDTALAEVAGLEQYRLDQESARRVRCKVVGEPGKIGRAARGVRETLVTLFGRGVKVDVEEVPALYPEKSGKFLLALRAFPLEEVSDGR
jgi:phenylacetate-coenzyme A ligase PaaK-like adenylate-forming protein